jgi:uncharacterized protein with von Willebrand factor type A (vWA) domain
MKKEPNIYDTQFVWNSVTLTEKIVLFSRYLKSRGFKIFLSNVIDVLKGLEMIDLSSREDFVHLLKATLVTNDLEWRLFDDLYRSFWVDEEGKEEQTDEQKAGKKQATEGPMSQDAVIEIIPNQETQLESIQGEPEKTLLEGNAYSPVSFLERQDLERVRKKDIQIAQLILKNMMSPFKVSNMRRFKKSKRAGDIDFRFMIKRSAKAGEMPIRLFYRKRKKRLKRLVIIADVSGSMDRYARFVMPFILGMKGIGRRAEVYVFSTSLTSITQTIKRTSFDKVMETMAKAVPEWSGGTKIGYSLHQFNERQGDQMARRETVVVVFSDGWDLGAKDLLRREMEILQRKAHAVIWLNPLAGELDYKPICKGMQTALPYVDYFLPANSLNDLNLVGRTLTRVMLH